MGVRFGASFIFTGFPLLKLNVCDKVLTSTGTSLSSFCIATKNHYHVHTGRKFSVIHNHSHFFFIEKFGIAKRQREI